MYRIRLASGEESAFRSVEELARGIQSGVISPEAQVYQQGTQEWLPITSHPEYEDARERAATLAATSDPDPAPLPALLEATGGPAVPIYQMFSRSAKELEERRRPTWVMPTAITLVGLVLLAGLAVIFLPEHPGTEEAVRITNMEPRQSLSPVHLAPISADSFRAARLAPGSLASRMARGVDSTRRIFLDDTRSAGLTTLLATERLRNPAGLRDGLVSLARFDSLLRGYRTAQRRIDSVFRDSARSLEHEGTWTRSDLLEWRARVPRLEAIIGGARVDSVVSTIGQVYTLLLAQQEQVTLTPTAIHFGDRAAGATYDSLRTRFVRLVASHPPADEHPPAPILILLQGIADGSLPPRNPR